MFKTLIRLFTGVTEASPVRTKSHGNDLIAKPINTDIMFVTMSKWITPKRACVYDNCLETV